MSDFSKLPKQWLIWDPLTCELVVHPHALPLLQQPFCTSLKKGGSCEILFTENLQLMQSKMDFFPFKVVS